MRRIIKSTEIPGGCCDGMWYDSVKKQNQEDIREDILTCGKLYTYLGPVKSTTKVFGWRVTDGERFFAATYSHQHGVSSVINIYRTTPKGEFNCQNTLKQYPNYCDIETVLDIFFNEYIPEEDEFDYKETEMLDDEDVVEVDEAKSLEL